MEFPKHIPKSVNACACQAWSFACQGIDTSTGEISRSIVPFRCGSWRHEGPCADARAKADYARVMVAVESREYWCYMVLTLARNHKDTRPMGEQCREAWRSLWRRWQSFYQNIKRNYGESAYIFVAEEHSDGWPHVNILLSNEVIWKSIEEHGYKIIRKNLNKSAVNSKWGLRFWIQNCRDKKATASYSLKLGAEKTVGELTKATQLPVHAPPRFRRLRASRGLLPPKFKKLPENYETEQAHFLKRSPRAVSDALSEFQVTHKIPKDSWMSAELPDDELSILKYLASDYNSDFVDKDSSFSAVISKIKELDEWKREHVGSVKNL